MILRKFVYALRFAHEARSQGGVVDDMIGSVIEIIWPYDHLDILQNLGLNIGRFDPGVRRPQWLISDDGIESMHYTYFIDSSRVHEPDWISHMTVKTWVDIGEFQSAISVARALFPKTEGT